MLSNDWFAGESESDKGRIITRGRMFAENGNTSGVFRTRVEIQWKYKGETDGMPSAAETEVIDRIMNLLTEALERSKIAILTAIHIGGKQALYVYYTQELQAFSGKVNELLGKLPSLPIQIGATGDPDWTDYKQMLKKFGINH